MREVFRRIGPLASVYRLVTIGRRMAALEKALERLSEHDWTNGHELASLRAQADHLMSSVEVPDELAGEFVRWKAYHPLPDQPLVTVCVATYNRARLLVERCIPSILQQTYGHLELVVVGDGCTDETAEAVGRINDARLRFVNLPQRGKYPADPMLRWMVAGTQAINSALSMASGHFVTHLDDDDEYARDRLEKLVAFALSEGCDFAWHPFWREDGQGGWILHEAREFARGHVTSSSVFYRSWFTCIPWNNEAYRFREPGDWNRFRRIKYLAPVLMRYPEPLLWHYREGTQRQGVRPGLQN